MGGRGKEWDSPPSSSAPRTAWHHPSLVSPTPTPLPRHPRRRQSETQVGIAAGEDISLGRRVTSSYRGGQGREEAEPLQDTDQCTSPSGSSSLALCRVYIGAGNCETWVRVLTGPSWAYFLISGNVFIFMRE